MDFTLQKKQRLDHVDLSRKGSVDIPLLDTVQLINDMPHFFTTSSCSGRIILFENTDAAQAVLKTDGLQIGEHTISVAISNPPERKAPLSTRMDLPSSRTPNLGSGKKETDFRGKARTQVSLVPRAVRQGPSQSTQAKGSVSGSGGDAKPKTGSQNASGSGGAMSNDDFRKMLLKK